MIFCVKKLKIGSENTNKLKIVSSCFQSFDRVAHLCLGALVPSLLSLVFDRTPLLVLPNCHL